MSMDESRYAVVWESAIEILGTRTPEEIALATRIVKGFDAKAERLLREFDSGLSEGDLRAACRAAHTLKGSALNLGLSRLADACQLLEDGARGEVGTHVVALRRATVTELAGEATGVLARIAAQLLPDS